MRARGPLIALVMAGIAAAGCGEAGFETATTAPLTVRDSAGVTIVENHDSAWTAETRWRLADAPDLVIGSVDGSVPGTDWGRVGDVVTVGDRIAVVASRQDEIRFFHAGTGEFKRVVGGTGEGPTEFGIISRVDRLDDNTIAAVEANTGKVVAFPVDGSSRPEVWSTGNPELDGYFTGTVAGWLPNGDYLLRYRPGIGLLEREVQLLDARWQQVGQDGGLIRELPGLPHMRFYEKPGGYRGWVIPGPAESWQVHGAALWHTFPETWELTRVDVVGGQVDRIVRREFDLRPVPEGLVRELRELNEEQARQAPEDIRDFLRRNAEEQIYAEALPAFLAFLVSPDGLIWVNEQLDPDPTALENPIEIMQRTSSFWTILDPEGRWLGTIEMPEEFEVKEVGVDYVLGVREDDLGVPFVERYRILKPE